MACDGRDVAMRHIWRAKTINLTIFSALPLSLSYSSICRLGTFRYRCASAWFTIEMRTIEMVWNAGHKVMRMEKKVKTKRTRNDSWKIPDEKKKIARDMKTRSHAIQIECTDGAKALHFSNFRRLTIMWRIGRRCTHPTPSLSIPICQNHSNPFSSTFAVLSD